MRLDIFEGARRINLVLSAAVGLTVFFVNVSHTPYVSYDFKVLDAAGTRLERIQDCPPWTLDYIVDEKHRKGFDLPTAQSVESSATTERLSAAGHLVHIRICGAGDKETIEALAARFSLPPDIASEADKTWVWEKLLIALRALLMSIASVVGLFVLSKLIGWVVRGFFPSQE